MGAQRAASPSDQFRVPMTLEPARAVISRGRYAPSRARSRPPVATSRPSVLPETRDRMCACCGNRAVVALGPVTASATGIRCAYRCPMCSTDFVLVFSMRRMIETDWSTPDVP